jgi:hypothetical protein
VRNNYSLFKNNSAARSARLDKEEEGSDADRPAFRRSNMAGSAARAMRLADEERKRLLAESEAPGEGERSRQQTLGTGSQLSVGLRAGGGIAFERAKPPAATPAPQPLAAEGDAAAPEKSKSGLGSAFAKLFSVFGGDK